MDHGRFSTIAHGSHTFCSPVNPRRLMNLLDRAELRPGDRVLDIGCGKGELLVRLCLRRPIVGVGLDTNADFLAAARQRAFVSGIQSQTGQPRLRFKCQPAAEFKARPGSLALVACVGASQALGGPASAWDRASRWLRPGGHFLLGEPFWRRAPASGYLRFLGASPADLATHRANRALSKTRGWELMGTAVSNAADWDRYESRYAQGIRDFAAAHPADPDTPAMRERIRAWQAACRRWGRTTLGFALYLFQKPAVA